MFKNMSGTLPSPGVVHSDSVQEVKLHDLFSFLLALTFYDFIIIECVLFRLAVRQTLLSFSCSSHS